MKIFTHYPNNASTNSQYKKRKIIVRSIGTIVILFIFSSLMYYPLCVFSQVNTDSNYNNNNAIIKDPNKDVPSVVVTFEEKGVEMDPFMYSQRNPSNTIETSQLNETQKQIITKIGNANLFETQSDIGDKLNINQGDKITLSYEKEPLEIKAYLVDYDTEDETEIYPVKQIDYSTFSIPKETPEGLINLEIRCFFENNEQITYTTPVFVETTNPVITTQDVDDQNNEENNDNGDEDENSE